MRELDLIADLSESRRLPFLVSGGHAVIVHGYGRTTFDLDLIIRRSDREGWVAMLTELGYRPFHEGPTFYQFAPGAGVVFPLDLMFVNETTFARLAADGVPRRIGAREVRVVSLMHLLALKCHAIRHGHPGRIVKDTEDLIQLIPVNQIDVDAPVFRELVLKHGTAELYEKLRRAAGPL
jgi:hypothetical protein